MSAAVMAHPEVEQPDIRDTVQVGHLQKQPFPKYTAGGASAHAACGCAVINAAASTAAATLLPENCCSPASACCLQAAKVTCVGMDGP